MECSAHGQCGRLRVTLPPPRRQAKPNRNQPSQENGDDHDDWCEARCNQLLGFLYFPAYLFTVMTIRHQHHQRCTLLKAILRVAKRNAEHSRQTGNSESTKNKACQIAFGDPEIQTATASQICGLPDSPCESFLHLTLPCRQRQGLRETCIPL